MSIAEGEGLWPPDSISLPAGVRSSMPRVVRVRGRLRFSVHVFSAESRAHEARQTGPLKEFLPGGGVVWHVYDWVESLDDLAADPAARLLPGLAEIAEGWAAARLEGADHYLTEPVYGSATGVIATDNGVGQCGVWTNYHVAREAVERLARTDGVDQERPEPVLDLAVVSQRGEEAAEVRVVRNASEAQWRAGDDWATLECIGLVAPAGDARLAASVEPGEPLWTIGFPTRTRRRRSEYPDADDSLRVATGPVISADSREILAAIDGVAGSSGSPAFNEAGELVGLFRVHSLYEKGIDQRLESFGGHGVLVPVTRFSAR